MKNLFSSRVFWVAFITLLVIVVSGSIPGFTLDVEHTAGLVVVVAAYLIAFSASPGDGLKSMLISRKFWFSLFGLVVIFLDAFHILPAQFDIESLAGFVVIIGAYVLMLAKDPGNGL